MSVGALSTALQPTANDDFLVLSELRVRGELKLSAFSILPLRVPIGRYDAYGCLQRVIDARSMKFDL